MDDIILYKKIIEEKKIIRKNNRRKKIISRNTIVYLYISIKIQNYFSKIKNVT